MVSNIVGGTVRRKVSILLDIYAASLHRIGKGTGNSDK